MLEMFDDDAKLILHEAARQARSLQHHYVGTEHVLLGVLARPEKPAARALAALGVELAGIQAAVVEIIDRGIEPVGETGHLPFTPRTRQVLELAEAERARLGAARVAGVHVLLALAREGEGVAAQILVREGVRLRDVERAVAEPG